MIDSRHPHPTHIRDLVLLAAATAADEHVADPTIVADLDVVDVLAITARLVHGHLQALTAGVCSAEVRHDVAGQVLGMAASMVPDRRAVNAVATVVGASGQDELETATAIGRCLSVFSPDELAEAAIALLTATIVGLAMTNAVSVADVVRWSAGDGERSRLSTRPSRSMFCTRDAVTSADAAITTVDHHR